MKDPVKLFRAAVVALNEERWLDVARLCDPVSLQEFKHSALAQFDVPANHVWTVEDFLRHSPDMPREVAEYQLTQIQQQVHPDRRFARDFPSLSGIEELSSLAPEQVFASWLEGRSVKTQFETMVREGRISNAALEAHRESMASMKHDLAPIGWVQDGEDIVHVLYRWGAEDSGEIPAMARAFPLVTSCIRQSDRSWRLIADYNFLSIGSMSVGVEDSDGDAE